MGPQVAPAAATTVSGVGNGVSPLVQTVHDQVVQVLTPIRSGPDGTYSLTLQLQPEGLGRVVAHMEVAGTQVSVHLMAETAEGQSALRAGLHRLGQDLARGGAPANVQLRNWAGGGPGGGGPGGGGTGPQPGAGRTMPVAPPAATATLEPDPVVLPTPGPSRLLDVQL